MEIQDAYFEFPSLLHFTQYFLKMNAVTEYHFNNISSFFQLPGLEA